MATVGERITVSTTAVVAVEAGEYGVLKNADPTNSVSLGGAGVAAATGYELAPGEVLTIEADADDVYAIRTDAADVVLHVLKTRSTD